MLLLEVDEIVTIILLSSYAYFLIKAFIYGSVGHGKASGSIAV